MLGIFDDLAAGNLAGVTESLARDVIYENPAGEQYAALPDSGVWRGREAVVEAFRRRAQLVDVLELQQRDVVAEGDRALVVTYQRIRHLLTGAEAGYEASALLSLDDEGLVRYWRVLSESAAEADVFDSDLDERLLAAVRAGDSREVGALLRRGADPNHRETATGLTTLQTAAGLGEATVVAALVAAGGDVHSADSRAGGTALHKAVQRGDLRTIRVLVEAGAFVDAVAPTTGHTPLMDALWYKWPDVVAYLLERNAGLGLHTHYGFSLREHFEYELNVNTRGKDKLLVAEQLLQTRTREDERAAGEQRLMAAVTEGDQAAVRGLLASGAAVDERFPVLNGFNDLHTPLLVASRDGHTEIVRLLLDAGADVNATEPTFGAVPLHKAVYNGHADITRILVERPGIDLDFQGATNGYSPLHDALWHGYEECARVLMAAGARTDLVGHDGKTPLDVATESFGAEHPLVRELAALG
ncbi:ankyrin repeat domain-containing protein [Streptomyces sp. DSM 44915]|uniref:Ankyrin repeat domain-containing protein n=1 Tax=Streptomyces chisholmiae TaxID=3075540 RepID=A0ABU2JZD0_9ACTN|nr:ankyrin repeat domain-containing protein [Streptomyces sp. DSM 44915]MDT0270302.1 ankyrin repeat domain-containing protein [Streptomyces sp. DSM 44915]